MFKNAFTKKWIMFIGKYNRDDKKLHTRILCKTLNWVKFKIKIKLSCKTKTNKNNNIFKVSFYTKGIKMF